MDKCAQSWLLCGAGGGAARILQAWEQLAPVLPPENWRPPPPAGYVAAQGMRRIEDEPWRPVRNSQLATFAHAWCMHAIQMHHAMEGTTAGC